MAGVEPARGTRAIIDPSDPEGRRAAFERLLRSDRFAEHRRKLQAEVEHWPPIKDMPLDALPLGWTVKEWSPSEEAAFRQEISRYVLDTALCHCWLYYRAFLPEGDAHVRRGRAAVTATAERAAKLAGELANAMRRLWQSGNPIVQEIFAPFAGQYPRGDGLPSGFGDPGFVVMLEEIRRRVELLATALPADVGGRRRSVIFEELALRLAGIYSGFTGLPAQVSARAGAREGQYFRFVKAVVCWLNDAAPELSDVKFDFPPSDDALRMVLHRMAQANITPASK
jgi:hypothetical protein